ncbi:MAG: septum formation initiator [Peptococcaceae bacterium]|jgi:cell division protein FtsB|nr:septum formation initiator [Peptococcaceae bacterium]NLM22096.1 septum formation initiator [Peptococcaceae bacterium]
MIMAQRKLDYNEPLTYENQDYAYPYQDEYDLVTYRRKPEQVRNVSRRNKLKFQSLAVMLIVIGLFGFIGAKTVHTTIVKGAEIRSLEKDLQILKAENDMLQVEVDSLASVARIEKAALAMGMEKPEGTIYVASAMLQPEKEVGVEQQIQKTAATTAQEETNSVLGNVFKIFTSFFASTQR